MSTQSQPSQSITPTTVTPVHVYIILIAGVMAVSTAAILIRYAQGAGAPSLLIAAGRVTLATLMITPFVLRRYWSHVQRLAPADMRLAFAAGAFLALHFIAWVSSLEYTSVLISVVIVTTSPIWVALLEVLLLRTVLPRSVIVGLGIAIAGGLLISFAGDGTATAALETQDDLLGAALALIGSLMVSVYFVIGRKLRATLPILPYIWLVYGFASLLMLPVLLLTQTPVIGYSLDAYVMLFLIALLPQLVGHSSLNYAVGHLPATLVSMATQLEPIGSAALAFLLFNEIPLPLQIAGSAVILAGVMLASIGQRRDNRKNRKARAA
jgi:drug/metabolite transporter (DMT)-like permease